MTATKRKARQYYSLSFKRMVIEDYLSGSQSQVSILKKYSITFNGAISYWLREQGRVNTRRKAASLPRLKQEHLASKNNTSGNQSSVESLQKRIKELERLLEDEQLRSDGYNRMIDYAERELKITIRKKSDTK